MTPDKFRLSWNEHESNFGVAFRDLREEKEFFDVTLACEDEQIEALEKFQDLLSKIEWREKNGCYTSTKKPFQKGLLCSIKSTIELFHEMKEEGVKYILTKRYMYIFDLKSWIFLSNIFNLSIEYWSNIPSLFKIQSGSGGEYFQLS